MQKTFALLLGILLVLPAQAQDEAADPAVTEAKAEAEAEAAEAIPETVPGEIPVDGTGADAAELAAPAEAGETPPEGSAESAPVDAAGAEGEAFTDTATDTATPDSSDPFADSSEASPAEEEGEPRRIYIGAAFDSMTFSASSPDLVAKFGGQEFSGIMVHGRLGMRVHEMIAVEFQGGAKAQNGVDPGTVQVANYLGLFVVPTGNLFDLLEVSAPIGFNSFSLIRGEAKEKFQRLSFGVNLELPVRVFKPMLPDLRFSVGYKTYYVETGSRVYGYHAGMRWDFEM